MVTALTLKDSQEAHITPPLSSFDVFLCCFLSISWCSKKNILSSSLHRCDLSSLAFKEQMRDSFVFLYLKLMIRSLYWKFLVPLSVVIGIVFLSKKKTKALLSEANFYTTLVFFGICESYVSILCNDLLDFLTQRWKKSLLMKRGSSQI